MSAKQEARIASLLSDNSRLKRELRAAVKKEGVLEILRDEMVDLIVPMEGLPGVVLDPGPKPIREHMVMHLSDSHCDEVVEPHQVGGLEKFNFPIALCRAEKYVDTLLKWKATLHDHTFEALHILNYGDHTSGEIHGAASRSEYRNMFRNCIAAAQMQALMFRDLAPHFPTIYVWCVPGNHGRRSTKKDFHGAWDNWDYLIYETARQYCLGISNIQFAIPNCFSINVDINGWGFHVEHGDDIKGWMGIPWYGLERKTKRLTALHNSFHKQVSYFTFGHFHTASTSADLRGEMLINGAWPATNPYGYESFSGYREPMQLIHGVHEKHGVSWRLPVKLKDEASEANGPSRYKVDLAREEYL